MDNTETTIPDGADLSVYNDVMFVNHYATELATSDVSANFVSAYEAKYGNTPSAFAALAYDCVMMYKAAIEAAGSADPVEVRDALAADGVVYDCITGTYSLDETGTPIKGASIIAFEAGTGADGKPAVVSKLLDVVTELPQA